MGNAKPRGAIDFRVRANLPKYFRIAAIAAIGVTVLAVAAGFYNARSKSPFRLKAEHTQLSTDVVSEVSGYERLETDDGVPRYFIKADHARTFSDNHQELENVYLEVYDPEGLKDQLEAESALYIPESEKNFTTYLKGNVRIQTKQGLKVQTHHVTYSRKTEIAEADEKVAFERENVRGTSIGATVRMAEKRIELLRDAEIETFESPELVKSNVRYAKINANSATFDQVSRQIDLDRNVVIAVASRAADSKPRSTEINAGRAVVRFVNSDGSPKLKTFELFENVRIASVDDGARPTNIEAHYGLFDKDADRYELRDGVHIIAAAGERPTEARANQAIFEPTAHKLALTGNAEVLQGDESLKGDAIFANLFPDNKIRDGVARGNAAARQVGAERTTEIKAPELNAAFAQSGEIRDANAVGESTVDLVPVTSKDYSRVVVSASRGIGLVYKGAGLIDRMTTDGRTTINLSPPNSGPDAANRRLTADRVTTAFQANGRDLKHAEAVGNAELFIEPLTAGAANYKTTISAPRFDCEFFAVGNHARTCVAGRKAKSVRVPMVPTPKRGAQTLTADQLTANFAQGTSDVETMDASGSAKFNELDRTAIARQMTFTRADEVIRLRGGEPTAWDSSARAKAKEIDWDTRNNKSFLRGSVGTTYYSRKQMNDAAPFGSSDKPVFITADSAEIDHAAETAIYAGNARGWQENNYVRGNRLLLDQRAGRLVAEGSVQSALHNARIRGKAVETNLPTYAAASNLTYERDKRLLQYRNDVDIRQGTDRITANSADIYLDEKYELIRTVAEANVVIVQPNRRATGDWAQYTAVDETAILRGSPATIVDGESGSSQNSQVTFYMRENRVVTDAKSKPGSSGRSRSVYKVRPNQ